MNGDKCPGFVKVYRTLDPIDPQAIFDPSDCRKKTSVVYLTSDGSQWIWDNNQYKRIKAPICPAVVMVKNHTDPNAPSATFVPSHCSRNSGVTYMTDDGAKWSWDGYRYSRSKSSPSCSNVVNVTNTNDPNIGNPVFNPPFCPRNPSFVYRTSDGAEWRWGNGIYYQTKAQRCPCVVKTSSTDPNNPITQFDPPHCARTYGSKYIGTDGSNWIWNGSRYTCSNPSTCPVKILIEGSNDPNLTATRISPSHCAKRKDTVYVAPDGSEYKWDGLMYQQISPPRCPSKVFVQNSDDPNSLCPAPPVFNPSYCHKNTISEYHTPNGSVWKWDASTGRYYLKTAPPCPAEIKSVNSNDPNVAGTIFDPPHCGRLTNTTSSPVDSSSSYGGNDCIGSMASEQLDVKYCAPDGSEWIWDGSVYIQIKPPNCPTDQVFFTGSDDPNDIEVKFSHDHCQKDMSGNPDLLFTANDKSQWKWSTEKNIYVMVKPPPCPPMVSVIGTINPNQNKGPESFSPSHCSQQPSSTTTYSTEDGAEWKWDGQKYQQTKPPNCPKNIRITNVNDPNVYGTVFDPAYCAAKSDDGTTYAAADGSLWVYDPTTNKYKMTKPPNCPDLVQFTGANDPHMSSTVFKPSYCAKDSTPTYQSTDGSQWKWDSRDEKYYMTKPPDCPSNVNVLETVDPNDNDTSVFKPEYCKTDSKLTYILDDTSEWKWDPNQQSYVMSKLPNNCPQIMTLYESKDPNSSTTVFNPINCARSLDTTFKASDGSEWKYNPATKKYDQTKPPDAICPSVVYVDAFMPEDGAKTNPDGCLRRTNTTYKCTNCSEWIYDGTNYVNTKSSCLTLTEWMTKTAASKTRLAGTLPGLTADLKNWDMSNMISVSITTPSNPGFNVDWTNMNPTRANVTLDPSIMFNEKLYCRVMRKPTNPDTIGSVGFLGSKQTDFVITFNRPVEGIVLAISRLGMGEGPRTCKFDVDVSIMSGTADFYKQGPGLVYGTGGGGCCKIMGVVSRITGQMSTSVNPDDLAVSFITVGISGCGRFDPLAGYIQTLGCRGSIEIYDFNDPNDPDIDFDNFSNPSCRNDPDSIFVTPDGQNWIWTGSNYVHETPGQEVWGCEQSSVTSDGDPNLSSTTIVPRQCYQQPDVTITSNTGVKYKFNPQTGVYDVLNQDVVFDYNGTPNGTSTYTPEETPTYTPNYTPEETPTYSPTYTPEETPTYSPDETPTYTPDETPTYTPTYRPEEAPTYSPTYTPEETPTYSPTYTPEETPTYSPTYSPDETPTYTPTYTPEEAPTYSPTYSPDETPTYSPTYTPDETPTYTPNNTCVQAESDGNPNLNPIYPRECARKRNIEIYDTINNLFWEWDGTSYQRVLTY